MTTFLRMEKKMANFALAQSLKHGLAGKLQRHHEEAEVVDLHGGNGSLHQIGLGVENMDEKYGEQVQDSPDGNGVADTA